MSTKYFKFSHMGRRIVYGTIAGLIAGIVMLAIMIALMTLLKLPPNLFPMLVGSMAGQGSQTASIMGVALHLTTSMIIGTIFGIVTSKFGKLMKYNFGKGIILGVITGIIVFVVLFIPVSIILLPQNMMNFTNMMNPGMSSQTIMSIILTGSLLSHLSYGIILGIVTITTERMVHRKG